MRVEGGCRVRGHDGGRGQDGGDRGVLAEVV